MQLGAQVEPDPVRKSDMPSSYTMQYRGNNGGVLLGILPLLFVYVLLQTAHADSNETCRTYSEAAISFVFSENQEKRALEVNDILYKATKNGRIESDWREQKMLSAIKELSEAKVSSVSNSQTQSDEISGENVRIYYVGETSLEESDEWKSVPANMQIIHASGQCRILTRIDNESSDATNSIRTIAFVGDRLDDQSRKRCFWNAILYEFGFSNILDSTVAIVQHRGDGKDWHLGGAVVFAMKDHMTIAGSVQTGEPVSKEAYRAMSNDFCLKSLAQ